MPCVYALVDSVEPKKYRYIGISKYDTPEKRFKAHLNASKTERDLRLPVYKWIKSIVDSGGSVAYVLLDYAPSWEKACDLEAFYIKKYREENFKLLNLTDGGEGGFGYTHSEETKEKIRSFWTKEKRDWQRKNTNSRDPHIHDEAAKERMQTIAKDVHKDRRERGVVWGKDMGPKEEVDEEVVALVLSYRESGIGYRSIAAKLDEAKIKPPRGEAWSHTTVKRIIDRRLDK